jgi:hypothetical protein
MEWLLLIPLGMSLYLIAVGLFSVGYGGPNAPGWRWKWQKPKQPTP